MGRVGLEPTYTEVGGFTVRCNCHYATYPYEIINKRKFMIIPYLGYYLFSFLLFKVFIICWDFDLQLLAFISVGTNYHTVFWTVANNDTSFSGSWQTLTVKYYKFPFNTFFLARFRDCGLLELYLLVLFHDSPCEFLMCPYYRTISRFSLYCRIHFCFSYIIINYMF